MRKTVTALAILGILIALPAPTPVSAEATPGQALVVFHRPNKMKWKAARFNVEQDGVPVGQLLAGTELAVTLDPGTYTFTGRATSFDGTDYLTLTVEAGKTYRVKGEVLASWPVGRPKFTDVKESGVATEPVAAPAASGEQAPALAAPQPATAGNLPAERNGEAARLGLKNFAGEWRMDMWSLAADGRRLEGTGSATGTLVGDYAVRITIDDFNAPDVPDATGGGEVLIAQHPEKGLSLESDLRVADRKLKLTGQFDTGKYVFYLFAGGGETVTGVKRSSLRIEVHSTGGDEWVAGTYASFEGNTTQVQSVRFTRP